MTNNPYAYDKAKFHHDSIAQYGLADEHAYNHTTYFLSWLIKRHLISDFFESESDNLVKEFRAGLTTINKVYEYWDCCLVSDMLNDEGNAFAMAYFDFAKGEYLKDYQKHLQKDLPSEFHVPYTVDNERVIHAIIDQRYQQWKNPKQWWQFWK